MDVSTGTRQARTGRERHACSEQNSNRGTQNSVTMGGKCRDFCCNFLCFKFLYNEHEHTYDPYDDEVTSTEMGEVEVIVETDSEKKAIKEPIMHND